MGLRILEFPANHSIGYLYLLSSFGEVYRHEYGINAGSAEGILKIHVDEGKLLQLTVTKGEFESLEKLTADSLDSLIVTSYNFPVGNEKLRSIAHLSTLQELYLDSRNVDDDGLEHLKGLSNLKILSLSGSAVSDKGLRLISKYFPRLQNLCLSDSKISSDGLAEIANLNLKQLNLGGTQLSDEGLRHLSGMKSLSELTLYKTSLNGSGFRHLGHLNQLKILIASETALVAKELAHLQANVALEVLNLYKCPRLSDESVEYLNKLGSLKELTLVDCPLTKEAIERLKTNLPNCRVWSDTN